MKVAYPGREGAHSAAACAVLHPDAEAQALPSFADVVEAVAFGAVDSGVLPIESSVSGPVTETHDLLVDSAVSINAQAILPIRHFLVGVAEIPLEEIRVVRSHPAALDQCRKARRRTRRRKWPATAIRPRSRSQASVQRR